MKLPVKAIHLKIRPTQCAPTTAMRLSITADLAMRPFAATAFVIGDHKRHENVRPIKDILNERKTQVSNKVDVLERNVVPKLERSIHAVDNVSTELARRADEVRTDIRRAGRRAVEMVDAHVEQMVQEVDDLEQARLKVLDRQRDELKSHLSAAKCAINFRDRIMPRAGCSGEKIQFPVLHALETCTTALITTNIEDNPLRHARLLFEGASDTDVACKAKQSIGKVTPCQASAKMSKIEGEKARRSFKCKATIITVHAKDNKGDALTAGGDVISTRWAGSLSTENTPSTTITDNDKGSYTISAVCPSTGTFQMEVYVNGEKMATDVTITCVDSFFFDERECHPSITVSADGKRASIDGEGGIGHVSALGSTQMRHGQHTWKVKIGTIPKLSLNGNFFKATVTRACRRLQ